MPQKLSIRDHASHSSSISQSQIRSCLVDSKQALQWKLENTYPQLLASHIKRLNSEKAGVFSVSLPRIDALVYQRLVTVLQQYTNPTCIDIDACNNCSVGVSAQARKELQNRKLLRFIIQHVGAQEIAAIFTSTIFAELVAPNEADDSAVGNVSGRPQIPTMKVILQLGKAVHFMLRRSLHSGSECRGFSEAVGDGHSLAAIVRHRYLSKPLELQVAAHLFSVAMRDLGSVRTETGTEELDGGSGARHSGSGSGSGVFVLHSENFADSNPFVRTDKVFMSLRIPLKDSNVLAALQKNYCSPRMLPIYLPMVVAPTPWSHLSCSEVESGPGPGPGCLNDRRSGGYLYTPSSQYVKLRQYHPRQSVTYPYPPLPTPTKSVRKSRPMWQKVIDSFRGTIWERDEAGGDTTAAADHSDQAEASAVTGAGESPLLLDAIDYVSSVPWQVDGRMLALIRALEGEGAAAASPQDVDRTGKQQVASPLLRRLLARDKIPSRVARTLAVADLFHQPAATVVSQSQSQDQDSLSLYFPHMVDFRGRIYPQPEALNHMTGGDVGRALLRFANGRPLGRGGFTQLKLHLANLYGVSSSPGRNGTASSSDGGQLSVAEKISFIDRHRADIVASARNPLDMAGDGRLAWWMRARQPFQALAASIELVSAVDWEAHRHDAAGEPLQADELKEAWVAAGRYSDFVSYLPVHVDGNCNGLQHYAAMTRCVDESMAVNLLSKADYLHGHGYGAGVGVGAGVGSSHARLQGTDLSDLTATATAPVDVYTGILRLLLRRLRADDDNPLSRRLLLQQSDGPILTRSVVKKPIMTHISYGLSFDGAVRQLEQSLRPKLVASGGSSEKELKELAEHLATVLIGCIADRFKTTRNAMQYLSACASTIAAQSRQVFWHTPVVGMTVVQPIGAARVPALTLRDPLTARVRSHRGGASGSSGPSTTQSRRRHRYRYSASLQRRQASSFPPNFVHSLDATHLVLTALKMKRKKLAFAAVHDSYWTHAGDIPVLNRVLREGFVELHGLGGRTVLHDLQDQFIASYPFSKSTSASGSAFGGIPSIGKLDLNCVLNSTYFFQ